MPAVHTYDSYRKAAVQASAKYHHNEPAAVCAALQLQLYLVVRLLPCLDYFFAVCVSSDRHRLVFRWRWRVYSRQGLQFQLPAASL